MKLLISLLIASLTLLYGCDYFKPKQEAPAPVADVVTILPVCPTTADVARNARVDRIVAQKAAAAPRAKVAKKAVHHRHKAKKVAPSATKQLWKAPDVPQAP